MFLCRIAGVIPKFLAAESRVFFRGSSRGICSRGCGTGQIFLEAPPIFYHQGLVQYQALCLIPVVQQKKKREICKIFFSGICAREEIQ